MGFLLRLCWRSLPALLQQLLQRTGRKGGLPLTAFDLGDQGDHVTLAEAGVGPGPKAVDRKRVALAGHLVGFQGLLDAGAGGNFDDRGGMTETKNFYLHVNLSW
jgi:hypothetical protein